MVWDLPPALLGGTSRALEPRFATGCRMRAWRRSPLRRAAETDSAPRLPTRTWEETRCRWKAWKPRRAQRSEPRLREFPGAAAGPPPGDGRYFRWLRSRRPPECQRP